MKAYQDNLVVTTIEQPEDTPIKTPDGKHPWAVKVISVGNNVEGVSEGDLVAAAGKQQEFTTDNYIIHKSQVKAIVSEDEI